MIHHTLITVCLAVPITRNGNSASYSSSAGDVNFQIDKVMTEGDNETVELGASASFGPVGIGRRLLE